MTPAKLHDDVAAVREDVAYIRAKVEAIPDHEERIRSLEKRWWQFPASAIIAVAGLFLQHLR